MGSLEIRFLPSSRSSKDRPMVPISRSFDADYSDTPVFLFTPPLFLPSQTVESAIELYQKGVISWKEHFSSSESSFSMHSDPLTDVSLRCIDQFGTPSFLYDGRLSFSSDSQRLQYHITEVIRDVPNDETKTVILSHYSEILSLFFSKPEELTEVSCAFVMSILDHWLEFGVALVMHLVRLNCRTVFIVMDSQPLTWNRFQCYMALFYSNLLSLEDVVPFMLSRFLYHSDEQSVVVFHLCHCVG